MFSPSGGLGKADRYVLTSLTLILLASQAFAAKLLGDSLKMLHWSILPAFSRRSLGGLLRRCSHRCPCVSGPVRASGVISLFGKNNSPEYTEYARLCVRIFLSGIILTCFIKSAVIMLHPVPG